MDKSSLQLLDIANAEDIRLKSDDTESTTDGSLSAESCSILSLYPVASTVCLSALRTDRFSAVALDLLTTAALAGTPHAPSLKRETNRKLGMVEGSVGHRQVKKRGKKGLERKREADGEDEILEEEVSEVSNASCEET